MVSASDLKCYYTTNWLGGAITGTQIPSASHNNIFSNVARGDYGLEVFRCGYFKNTHTTESMDNFKIWLTDIGFPRDINIQWAFDPNNPAQTIANQYTAPTGVSWHNDFIQPEGPNVITLGSTNGSLVAGASFPVWFRQTIPADPFARLDGNATMSFEFQIPLGGTGSTGGGGTNPDTGGTGGNPPPTPTDYKVAIAGDWGCENTTDDVKQLMIDQGYNHICGVGDNAYASASCWTSRFTSLKSIMNSAYGNHEYEESGGVTPYKTFFGHNKTYFTYKFQNIQFFVIDTNIDGDPGSAQYDFISAALTASQNDNTVVWRIGVYHHPSYGAASQHTYNQASTRENYHTIMQNNKVNMVMTGHNHNWQRTNQLTYNSGSPSNPNVVDSASPFSRTTTGIIYVITGGGGHDSGSALYSLTSTPSYNGYQSRTWNGVYELVATNSGNTLTCCFRDTDGNTHDVITWNA